MELPTCGGVATWRDYYPSRLSTKPLHTVNYNVIGVSTQQNRSEQCCKLYNSGYPGHQLPKQSPDNKEHLKTPPNLFEITAAQIVRFEVGNTLVRSAISSLPINLLELLLHHALSQKPASREIVCSLISGWPEETLELKRIVCDVGQDQLEFGRNIFMVMFLALQKRHQIPDAQLHLKCLDLRGIPIKDRSADWILTVFPFASLPLDKRSSSYLSKAISSYIGDSLGIDSFNEMLTIPQFLQVLDKMEQCYSSEFIYVPEGEQLCIKIDQFELWDENEQKILHFFVSCALRKLTRCYLEISQIVLSLSEGAPSGPGLPVLILLYQNEMLNGLSVLNLDQVQLASKIIPHRFTHLQSLDIKQSWTSVDNSLIYLFSNLSHLRRLSLSFVYSSGSLVKAINLLKNPLEYLRMKVCYLTVDDFKHLSDGKHGTSLRELVLLSEEYCSTQLCEATLNALSLIPKLTVFEARSWGFNDSHVDLLCSLFLQHRSLSIVDLNLSEFNESTHLRLVEAAFSSKTMHALLLNYKESVFISDEEFEPSLEYTRFIQRIQKHYSKCASHRSVHSLTPVLTVMYTPYLRQL